MSLSELPSSPPESGLTLSRLLANQWVETLRQTACLEVLLHTQARILGAQTKQDPDNVYQELNAQVAASLKRLVAIYGAFPAVASSAVASTDVADATDLADAVAVGMDSSEVPQA